MELKYVAVRGCEFEFSDPTASGTVTIITQPSLKGFADRKGIYKGSLEISVTNFTSSIVTVPTSGIGTCILDGSAQHGKLEGEPFVLEDDECNLTIHGKKIIETTPYEEDVEQTLKLKLINANQTKVKSC